MLNGQLLTIGTTTNNGLAQNSTNFSKPLPFDYCEGFTSALITLSAGSVTITQQCAQFVDGPWYDPVDGTNTAIGVVCTTMSVARFVQFNPVMSPFIRFKCVETNVASTTIEFRLNYMERGRV